MSPSVWPSPGRGGRFKVVSANLHIKAVHAGEGTARRRFIIAYNPEQARHDLHTRERYLERIQAELAAFEELPERYREKARQRLLSHRFMGRYLKELKSGKLRIDKAMVREDRKLDGKYLLSTRDESLSAEDVAFGYKQLLEVERAFRTLKSTLGLKLKPPESIQKIELHP